MSALDNSSELEGLAAELTGSAGVPDDVTTADPMPESLAAEVETFDQHQAVHEGDEPPARREVPLPALQQERQKRQALQAELEAQRQQTAVLQQQWQQLMAQQQAAQQAAQEAAIPDFSEDPEGYIKAREQQFAQQLQAVQAEQQQRQQHEAVVRHVATAAQRLAVDVTPLEQAFRAENPSYDEASDFMAARADQILNERCPQATPEQRHLLKVAAMAEMAEQSMREGKNPAQVLYERAVAHGFKPGQSGWRAPGSGAQTHPAQAPVRSAPALASMRLEDVAQLDDQAFEDLWSEMSKANRPQFGFGGGR